MPFGHLTSNYRTRLTRCAVTAPVGKHRRQDYRPGLPGPRIPRHAGDGNVGLSLPNTPSTLPDLKLATDPR